MGDHDSTKQKITNESMLTPQRLAELASAKNELTWAYDGLKDPEGRFKLLFDRVFDCCVMIDEKGAIVYANEAACRVLGYAKEQILNLTARDLYPDEEAEKMQAAASSVLKDGVYYVGETEFIAVNGEVIAVEAGAVSLKLADRTYLICSFRDITERKRIDDEEADHTSDLMSLSRAAMDLVELSTEEDIYQFIGQRLMELAGNSVIIVNSFDDASSTFCLRAIQGVGEHMDSFLKILGRQPIGITAPISKEAKVGLTSGRLEKVPGGLYELANGGLPMSVCNDIETLLGLGDLYAMGFAWKGQLFGSAAVLTRRGAELRNLGIIETFVSQASVTLQRWQAEVALRKAHDELEMRVEQRTGDLADAIEKLQLEVTERKRSVEELRVKDSAIASSTNAIAISNLEGNVTYVNPSFLRLWGYDSDKEVVGRPAIEFWQAGEQVAAAIGTISEKEGWQGEVIALRKDGSAFVAELSASMVADGDGKPMCMMGSLLDITERKRLEEMLRESEELSRGMLEGATVGMYIVQDGKFLYVNPRFEEISGYTMAELSGADSLEHVHPDDREMVRKRATELLKGRSSTPYELRYICRDGRTLWCLERVASILYKGKPAAVGSFMDITELKRDEEALRESEEKHRTLLETGATPIYWIEVPSGEITFVNEKAEELFGRAGTDLLGHRLFEFTPEDEVALHQEKMQEAAREMKVEEQPIPQIIIRPSGELRYTEVYPTMFKSEGKIVAQVVCPDVTERKRAEEALSVSEERYRLLVDNASDAIIVAQDGMIKFSNPKASEITGYSQEELATTPFIELIHPDDKDMVVERHLRRLKGEELPHVYPFRIIDKNGTIKWLQINAAPLTWEDRPATLNFLSDITERKLTEDALQESERLYRLLADNASDIIWTMDMNLRFTYVSPAATSLLGYSFEEALAMTIEDFLTPESAEAATKALAEAQSPDKQGEDLLKTRSVEFELIAKDGTRVLTENRMRLLLDSDSQRVGILGVARNITDRKQVEEALRESEERFRALIENASDAVAILDAEAIIVYESPSVERMLGYRPEELIGKSVFDLVHPDDLPEVTARLASFPNDPTKITSMELRLRHKDGSWRWVEVVANNLLDNPQVQGFVANYRDITERKQADEALRESEERHRDLIENITDIIYTVDSDGTATYVSPVIEACLGYSASEIMGRSFAEFIYQDDIPRAVEGFQRILAGHISEDDYRLWSKSGEIRWIRTSSRPIFEGNRVVGTRGVLSDVTDRKRAEEALGESEKLYRLLADNVSDIIWTMDMNLRFTYVSPAATSLLGYSYEEAMAMTIEDFLTPESVKAATDALAEAQSADKQGEDLLKTRSVEFELIAKDGTRVWTENKMRLLLDADGQRVGILGVARDIAERKQADEALRDSEERFRRFVQSAPDIIFRWSVENGLEYVSPSASRVTGYAPEEITADPVLGSEIAKVRELNIDADYQQLAEERAALPSREFAFARKDGSEAYLEIRSVPVVDNEGSLVAFEGILRDVTERNWAEEQLRRSEEFSSTLLANAPNPILVINPDSSVRYVNPALEELTGFTSMELVGGISPYPWWTEETLEETGRDLADAITRGAQGLEQLCKKKNGERFWIELTSTPIMNDGELKYYLASWVDVTERKRAEEALRRSEYKYRGAIESARDGILLVDNDSVILDANRTCVYAVGFDYKEQLIGRSVYDIVAKETPEDIQERVNEILNKQGYITNVELTASSRDGREIPVEVNISQVFDEKGRPSGAIIVIRDITERKRVQEDILRYTRSLEALHAISTAISQTLDLDEMLNSALDKVLDVIEIDAGYIHLFDREKGELVLKVHRGVSEQHVAAIERLEVSEEAMERWHKYPEPAFNTRLILTESARELVGPAARKEGVATSVSVPLWSKSVMHGGLTLISRTQRRFSPEELELLKAIGNEIAVGIENAGLLEKTRELSATDELTGLFNRRQFYDVLESEMNRMQRYGGCFTLAMLDLDDFKEYNDRFGHTNGDAVLRSLAQTLKTVLRKPDMAFRYGGDEFTIILPETDAVKAKNIVDRIRSKRLKGLKTDNEGLEPCLGFSAGIAQFPENAETADGLVFLADTALYRSKRGGGNKSTLVSDLGELPAEIMDSATMDQVYALAATVDARDPHTYGHSKRVATISEMIGREIGLSIRELADLRAAALLHDIGKVGVPDSILTKPEKPEEHEWQILKKHPVEGAKIVGYVKELERLVPLIRHHHEWYDGSGYPGGLKGEDIPLGARIISVADAYDTMTTSRPYRDMVSQDEACEELGRCCGTQFDRQLVDAFRQALTEATVQAATQRS